MDEENLKEQLGRANQRLTVLCNILEHLAEQGAIEGGTKKMKKENKGRGRKKRTKETKETKEIQR